MSSLLRSHKGRKATIASSEQHQHCPSILEASNSAKRYTYARKYATMESQGAASTGNTPVQPNFRSDSDDDTYDPMSGIESSCVSGSTTDTTTPAATSNTPSPPHLPPSYGNTPNRKLTFIDRAEADEKYEPDLKLNDALATATIHKLAQLLVPGGFTAPAVEDGAKSPRHIAGADARGTEDSGAKLQTVDEMIAEEREKVRVRDRERLARQERERVDSPRMELIRWKM
ncbi:hypothetical protein LTR62_008212 [Meristemomyces frigidus]|uniref:Uncharacterized protein n=1 Tax=Meristemomyces frigidus TaxID=1508187 RepID=A0AAN7TB53_9PEZI|nr:hypothetical protein LTR62_008212 [Meristemomyces frigidus]